MQGGRGDVSWKGERKQWRRNEERWRRGGRWCTTESICTIQWGHVGFTAIDTKNNRALCLGWWWWWWCHWGWRWWWWWCEVVFRYLGHVNATAPSHSPHSPTTTSSNRTISLQFHICAFIKQCQCCIDFFTTATLFIHFDVTNISEEHTQYN